jgi:Fe-S cluster assembly iron-binding protein IscA
MQQKIIPFVRLKPGAAEAIRSFLTDEGLKRVIRIDLESSGCCDPTLGLGVGVVRDSDLVYEADGLTFVISPEVHRLVGDVTISYVDEAARHGFVLVSEKPVSEWAGVGVCSIKTGAEK